MEQSPAGPDYFCIGQLGQTLLGVTQSFSSPDHLASFRLHQSDKMDCNELVPFEAMLELSKQGWVHVQRKCSKKIASYKQGESKIWYFNKTVCKYYVRSLLSADRLFRLGAKEIHHFQSTAYYKSLLMMKQPEHFEMISPWQPLAFYQLLQQRLRKPNKKFTVEIEGAQHTGESFVVCESLFQLITSGYGYNDLT